LTIAGGTAEHAARLRSQLAAEGRRDVVVTGPVPQEELDHLYAGSLALVQPSLEEGFGLPVWEAAMAGLPVCVSDGGSLPEVTGALAAPFPATSVDAMAAAIDVTVERARAAGPGAADELVALARASRPSIAEFAATLRAAVEPLLEGSPRR
jgi:alpha-1,3-rhamnosyl/mannosyltransferase